jgi:hypothetical protein
LDVGEAVGGTSVGSVNPGLVGGNVDVTKRTGVSVGVCLETWTHAVNSKRRKRVNIIFRVLVIGFSLDRKLFSYTDYTGSHGMLPQENRKDLSTL